MQIDKIWFILWPCCCNLESESVQSGVACLIDFTLAKENIAVSKLCWKNPCMWWKGGIISTESKRWKTYFRILNQPRPPCSVSFLTWKSWRLYICSLTKLLPGAPGCQQKWIDCEVELCRLRWQEVLVGFGLTSNNTQLHLGDWPRWKWSQMM